MKALVLFSGGLDSTTALALAISKYGKENVVALSVSYGQKHIKEIEQLTDASVVKSEFTKDYYQTDLDVQLSNTVEQSSEN